MRESLFGNFNLGKERASAALRLSNSRDAQFLAAFALAVAGDAGRAQSLADDFKKRFPEDTAVQFIYLPTIRAQLAILHHESAKAVEILASAAHYELGLEGGAAVSPALYPVWARGEAYRASGQGADAAREYQKILDHAGVVINEPIGPMARLGVARAYALQGDAMKARVAYQDFFALWKDADTDVPILLAAKSEYAKLQ